MGREKKDIKPVLFKFGVALALSLGGVVYSILRSKRIKPPHSPPESPSPGRSSLINPGGGKSVANSDNHASKVASSPSNSTSVAPDKHEDSCICKVSGDTILAGLSPRSRGNGDNVGFLLPEFNELVSEFDLAATRAGFSPKKEVETPNSDVVTSKAFKHADREDYEREINNLKNMVRVLRDRERTLEIQLLEYCGLKEQETAVLELKNRLKLNTMEAKIFTLKMESLQADNRRLEAQVSDYATVVTELEAAKGKIKLLKKKLKFETEQNKEHILTLQQRVKLLQDKEIQAVVSDQDARSKLQKLKNLEEEVGELQDSNHDLRLENSELAQKLDYTQMLASSVLEDQEAELVKKEINHLRQQNDDLSKEIERLQADRCADVEELVYLRWINACLRYELRNYQPGPSKTIARDLSKTLSPKSEEKAKQLIIEYANKEGFAEKGITDSDLDCWSSPYSNFTDSSEFDDSSVDNSSTSRTDSTSKANFFSKMRRLVRGKDSHHHHHRRSSSLERVTFVEDIGGNLSDSSTLRGHGDRLGSSSQASSRSSLDLGRLKSPKAADMKDLEGRKSYEGPKCAYKRTVIGRDNVSSLSQENQLENHGSVQESELMKYAKVLKDSGGEKSKAHKTSTSFHSF